jgi:hypothetical protein
MSLNLFERLPETSINLETVEKYLYNNLTIFEPHSCIER